MKLFDYLREPALVVRKLQWMSLYRGEPREVTVDTWNGRLTFRSRDKFIGKRLFVNRAFESQLTEATMRVLRDEGLLGRGDGLLVDAGANIGMTSIGLVRHGHFQRALAFEPAPENVRLLGRNVEQNGLADRVRIMPFALSSQDGTMQFELSETNYGDHRIRLGNGDGAFGEASRKVIEVPVRRLDAALADAGVSPAQVSLLWVDVQGHEGHLFLGARELLATGVPVVTEFWPYGIRRTGMSRDDYLGIIAPNFTHYWILRDDGAERHPIAHLTESFERLDGPSSMEQVLLANPPSANASSTSNRQQ